MEIKKFPRKALAWSMSAIMAVTMVPPLAYADETGESPDSIAAETDEGIGQDALTAAADGEVDPDVLEAEGSESASPEKAFRGTDGVSDLKFGDGGSWSEGTADDGSACLTADPGSSLSFTVEKDGWLIYDLSASSNANWNSKLVVKNRETENTEKFNSSNMREWHTECLSIKSGGVEISFADTGSNTMSLANMRFVSSVTTLNTPAVTPEGAGSAKVSEASCEPGSTVTYTAEPAEGFRFIGWKNKATGEAFYKVHDYDENPAGAECSLVVYDEDPGMTACFENSSITGKGTQESPYILEDLEDVETFITEINSGNTYEGKYLELTANVSLKGSELASGATKSFKGILDGGYYSITDLSGTSQGLFASVTSGAEIRNLTVKGKITAKSSKTGLLAGSVNNAYITACSASGSIDGNDKDQTGGIIGYISGGTVKDCDASADITGAYDSAGGLVGHATSYNTFISSSAAFGDVSARRYAGGLIGRCNMTGEKDLADCYATGDVMANEKAGGLVGYLETGDITACYATGAVKTTGENETSSGGLIGYSDVDKKNPINLKNSVALNASVVTASGKGGRVVGEAKPDTSWGAKAVQLADNYAWVGIDSTVTDSDTGVTGADLTAEQLEGETLIKPFADWSNKIWILEAGKLPILRSINAGRQDSSIPSHIKNGGTGTTDPDDPKENNDLKAVAKALLQDENDKDLTVTAVSNVEAADGEKILVHEKLEGYYDKNVYAGGNVVKTTITSVPEGEDKGYASVTLSFEGEGLLLFDYMPLTSYGGEAVKVSVDGGEKEEISGKTFTLYTDWSTAVVPVKGDGKHTVEIIYERSKWNSDTKYYYLFDEARLVKPDDTRAGITAGISSEAEAAGCSVTADTENLASVEPGTKVTLKAQVPEGSGWVFKGWKETAESDINSNEAEKEVVVYDEDVNVYADFSKPFEGTGTQEDPYLINDLNDLKTLQENVNNGVTFEGKYFLQKADLDMSGITWTPIGYDLDHSFAGSYDGGGNKISNMFARGESYAGLFGRIIGGGVLKDIHIINANVKATISDDNTLNKSFVGAIAGSCEASILNCSVEGSTLTGLTNVGGLTGKTDGKLVDGKPSASISDCTVTDTTILATGNFDNAYAAGISGSTLNCAVERCAFEGSVTGYGRYVAGIVAQAFNDISQCCVNGDIRSIRKDSSSNIDANAVGGIAATYTVGTISDCYVKGDITGGRDNTGGIVGKLSSNATVKDCYILGNVSGAGTNAGGIVGSAESSYGNALAAKVSGNAFLGKKVALSSDNKADRITGSNSAKYPAELKDNYAYEGAALEISGTAKTVTADAASDSGADLTKAALNGTSVAAPFAGWDKTVWNLEAGKLPTLKNIDSGLQSADLPDYLKESKASEPGQSSGGSSGSSGGGGGRSSSGNSASTTIDNTPVPTEEKPSTGDNTTPDTNTDNAGVSFNDVAAGSWYAEDVKYVASKGILSGTGAGTYAPEEKVSRAMLITALYRMQGSPEVSGSTVFTDVAAGSWYSAALVWATKEGIVNGMTETTFGPDQDITREQLCTILTRFAKYNGKNTDADTDANLKAFTDNTDISGFAKESVSWTVSAGLVKGMGDGSFGPKQSTTRAQLAAILHRYAEL